MLGSSEFPSRKRVRVSIYTVRYTCYLFSIPFCVYSPVLSTYYPLCLFSVHGGSLWRRPRCNNSATKRCQANNWSCHWNGSTDEQTVSIIHWSKQFWPLFLFSEHQCIYWVFLLTVTSQNEPLKTKTINVTEQFFESRAFSFQHLSRSNLIPVVSSGNADISTSTEM